MSGAIVFSVVSSPAQAQSTNGTDRCLLLGPLVISGYIELFSQVAKKRRDQVGARAGQVSSLITLYDNLECDTEKLIGAVECLSQSMMTKGTTERIELRAQSCMKTAGMQVQ